MVNLSPMRRLLNNFVQDVPVGSSGYMMSQKAAYVELKRISGLDFGDDVDKWEEWVEQYELANQPTDEELRKTEGLMAKYGVKFPKRPKDPGDSEMAESDSD